MSPTFEPLTPENALPLVVRPDAGDRGTDLGAWIGAHRIALDEALGRAGGVLFRGFDVPDAAAFEQVVRRFNPALRRYVEGQSQREAVTGDVYTSTSYPEHQTITLHNELSYAHDPPAHIVFYCLTPADDGGETPIVDCREVLERLDPAVRELFEERAILYLKNMHGGRGFGFGKSWQAHFETDDRAAVDRYLEAAGAEAEWLADGTLRTRQVRPAVSRHPASGERIWFNQASLWHVSNLGRLGERLLAMHGEENLATHAFFEDGSPIPDEALAHVRDTMWGAATFFEWRHGDTLFLDNHLVAHGRNAFSGPRAVLVALC